MLNGENDGPQREPGFVRAGPEGHRRDSPEARLAHGRDEARPATLFPRLFSCSLARQRPPFVIRHSSLRMFFRAGVRWEGVGASMKGGGGAAQSVARGQVTSDKRRMTNDE